MDDAYLAVCHWPADEHDEPLRLQRRAAGQGGKHDFKRIKTLKTVTGMHGRDELAEAE